MINPGDHRERVSYLVAEIAREDPLLFSVLWEAVAQYVDNKGDYLDPEEEEEDAKILARADVAEVLLSELDKRTHKEATG